MGIAVQAPTTDRRSVVPSNLPVQPKQTAWYALYTCANRERKIAAELGRRNFEVYLPLYICKRKWKDRRVALHRPLFPGYLFVHFALDERLRVLQIPGIVRLVGFQGCTTPIPDEEISRIRRLLAQGLSTLPHPYLTAGKRIRVRSGPLAGMEGILLRRKNKTRFVVSVELIRRAVALEVDELELEADTF